MFAIFMTAMVVSVGIMTLMTNPVVNEAVTGKKRPSLDHVPW